MTLPSDLQLPRYGQASLADLLPGVTAALGVPVHGPGNAAALDLSRALAGARRVAVLLVDGLGAELLRDSTHLAPTLSALDRPVGDLSGPCPSTTPVSITTLGSGLPPGSHGVLGYVTAVPGEDRTLKHVRWTDDPDPLAWQARPTVFELAAGQGLPVTVVAPYAFAASGLTRAAYRGADYRGSVGAGDLVAGMLAALQEQPRALVYGYVRDLDLTGHARGLDSPHWRAELAVVDRIVELLATGLPDDAALLVTGDHGMLDIPPHTRIDLDSEPDLLEDVRLLAGEARARYVHVATGAADDVLQRWRAVLGSRAWVAGREEAVDAGLFGRVDRAVAARIGDVVALARDRWALTATVREPGDSRLLAYHGSLTRAELSVPLLCARGRALAQP